MDDFGSSQAQAPPQIIEKPTSVTMFGVLNIAFGGLGLVCSPVAVVGFLMAGKVAEVEMTPAYKIWSLFSLVIGVGFSIWLLMLGIGLLRLRTWARRGSVAYACVQIPWVFVAYGINVLAESLGWIVQPEGAMPGYIGAMCGWVIGLIYPVLLLIFMQTAKVKEAFSATGG